MGTQDEISRVVVILDEKKENCIGTGFFCGTDCIFTCCHVKKGFYQDGAGTIFYRQLNDPSQVSGADVAWEDREKDILILRDAGNHDDFFLLSEEGYQEGGVYSSTGITDTFGHEVHNGELVAESAMVDGTVQLKNANGITQGCSGSPVWDRQGCVVGMICQISEDRNRMLDKAYMIPAACLIDAYGKVQEEERNYSSEAERALDFDTDNRMVYDTLVNLIKSGEVVVPFIGGSMTAFSRTKDLEIRQSISRMFHLPGIDEDHLLRTVCEGELSFAIDPIIRDSGTRKNVMVEYLRHVLKMECSPYQMEEEAVALVAYMACAAQALPDDVLAQIIRRRRGVVDILSPSDESADNNSSGRKQIYSLCGSLEQSQIFSLSDFEQEPLRLSRFTSWLAMRRILYIDVDFRGEAVRFPQMLGLTDVQYAILPCRDDGKEKSERRNMLEDMRISAILYDESHPQMLEYILHKLLVDVQNEGLIRRFDRIDYRFSEQKIVGRDREMAFLQSFLDSEDDRDANLPLLWIEVYGEFGSGRSKLVHDFAKKNADQWELTWVDCGRTADFFDGIDTFLKSLERMDKDMILVFDDFSQRERGSEIDSRIWLRHPFHKKLRIIFISSDKPHFYQGEKAFMAMQYRKGMLQVKRLSREHVVELCVNYADYLRNSLVDNTYLNTSFTQREQIEREIEILYDRLADMNEPFLLYICLIHVQKILGLVDGSAEDINYLLSYIFNEKEDDSFEQKPGLWDRSSYLEKIYRSRDGLDTGKQTKEIDLISSDFVNSDPGRY